MTTNINIGQTLWRLLSAVSTSIISLVVWLGYYEVDNIFEYMVETYINGNFSTYKELYQELKKDARHDFVDYIFNEVSPKYTIELIKETI